MKGGAAGISAGAGFIRRSSHSGRTRSDRRIRAGTQDAGVADIGRQAPASLALRSEGKAGIDDNYDCRRLVGQFSGRPTAGMFSFWTIGTTTARSFRPLVIMIGKATRKYGISYFCATQATRRTAARHVRSSEPDELCHGQPLSLHRDGFFRIRSTLGLRAARHFIGGSL